jgi:hypothetical protein
MRETRTPVAGPSAWRPRDFRDREAYTVDLADPQIRGLDVALATSRRTATATESISADAFALGPLAADVAAWRDEVLHGRGFVVLRGLARGGHSEQDLTAIFWGLGAHIGRAVSQSPMGDRIGHVTDVGGRDRRERAYRSSRELTLHTDRCDVIGMLCLEPAWRGGVSGYASIHTVYNDILASRPALLEPLFRGFRYHRRAEQLPGEPPITRARVPVLSECEGELSVVFLRAYIEMAAQELGEPLRDEDVAALDYFEEVARAPTSSSSSPSRPAKPFSSTTVPCSTIARPSRTIPPAAASATCSASGLCSMAAGRWCPPCTPTRAPRASPAAAPARPITRAPSFPGSSRDPYGL